MATTGDSGLGFHPGVSLAAETLPPPPPTANPLSVPNSSVSNPNSRSPEKFGTVSFASLVSRSVSTQRFSPIELPPRQYGRKDGLPAVNFSVEEVKAGAKRFQHTLIAKFTFGCPPLKEIRQVFESIWPVKGKITISDIWDARHLVIILDSENDVRIALTSPVRKVGHAYFRLFRWTIDYHPKRESTRITTWVRLPGMPLELYDKGFIRSILSSFAFFIDIDARTKACTNLNFARACIEIDIRDQLPHSVWIQLPNDSGYWQSIEYEGNLSYCSHCKCHGHDRQSCRKLNKIASKPEKDMNPKQDIPSVHTTEGVWHVVKSKRNRKFDKEDDKEADSTVQLDAPSLEAEEINPKEKVDVHPTEIDASLSPKENLQLVFTAIPGENIPISTEPTIENQGTLVLYKIPEEGANDKEIEGGCLGASNMPAIPSANVNIVAPGTSTAGDINNVNGHGLEISSPGQSSIGAINSELSSESPVPVPVADRQIFEVLEPLSEDIAQKIASYGSYIFRYNKNGAPLDARTSYLIFKELSFDDEHIFQTLDDEYNAYTQAQIEDSSSHIEAFDSSVDLSRISKNIRQKSKGSRRSERSRTKKQDTNYVW